LNLLVFLFAFGVQATIGAIVDRWPAMADGGYPDAAYQTAFGCFWGLVLLAFTWFILGARRAPMDGSKR
jgi:hypothetical protein